MTTDRACRHGHHVCKTCESEKAAYEAFQQRLGPMVPGPTEFGRIVEQRVNGRIVDGEVVWDGPVTTAPVWQIYCEGMDAIEAATEKAWAEHTGTEIRCTPEEWAAINSGPRYFGTGYPNPILEGMRSSLLSDKQWEDIRHALLTGDFSAFEEDTDE